MEQGELIEEAAERAGLDPASLDHRHINSIQRSISLLFSDIESIGAHAEYRDVEQTIAVPLNAQAVPLPIDTIDVATVMVVDAQGQETPLARISRSDYMMMRRSTDVAGMPSGFWVSKSLPTETARTTGQTIASESMLLVLWPGMGLNGASVRVSYWRQIMNPTRALGDTIDARRNWLETIVRGLAAKIAEKYNPDREPDLLAKYERAIADRRQDQNMHPVTLGVRGFGWSRSRRH